MLLVFWRKFTEHALGITHLVTASKEVILSAGAIGTPQILLNSGIGDAADLSSVGVTPRFHLVDVGKNASAHISSSVIYFVNSTNTFDDAIRNATLRNELFAQWNKTHTGLLANDYLTLQGFMRMPSNATIFETIPDPAPGPNTGHFQSSIAVRIATSAIADYIRYLVLIQLIEWRHIPATHRTFRLYCHDCLEPHIT